jgi:hypothetical protein
MTRNYPKRMSLWHCREPVARTVAFSYVIDSAKHRSGHGADRFLAAVPAAQAVELRLVVAVLLS